ncbi:bifunctional aspartate transaminase/aspartate 4-decarboxylase [Enterococcus gilvus]|uniref:bifunctional aspartate transaminase/aspartate 4-decarboxylase n=1 Tax=Enterococcus gilvus TaxID=160453 RepID=UPI003D6AC235
MVTKKEEQQLETLGAFEISNDMLKLAQHNEKNNIFLNAGRGNPNWINTKARLAFARIIEFGAQESRRTMDQGDLAGYTTLEGIRERLETFLDSESSEIDRFLLDAVDYAHDQLGADKDEFVKELVDGAIGNNYPVPSRILKNSERVINAYLESALYRGEKLADQTELFPTEGGTAAIVYIFNSLKENKLIKKGDKIAINTPIFTPYLQIPELNDYDMVEVDLRSTEENNWEIQASEIDKLNDKDIKAFFIVNPSNPGAMAFDDAALAEIKKIVEARPDFIIITDDVYGTFVTDFKTVYSVVPHNTLLVYSYSKLFGATGWRLGVIAANKDNVFDRLIGKLDEKDKEELNTRYAINVIDPEKMSFIDRMVADSRSVGLYHTSGLSTPQQIMEVLFSLTHLLNREKDAYIDASKAIVDRRYDALYKGLKIEKNPSKENSKYYSLIDIYGLAEELYGSAFKDYLVDNFEQVDFLYNLSEKNGVVLMDGVGFGTQPGELRVSEANLPDEDYEILAKQILELLGEYHAQFLQH